MAAVLVNIALIIIFAIVVADFLYQMIVVIREINGFYISTPWREILPFHI